MRIQKFLLAVSIGVILVSYSNCMQGGFHVKALKGKRDTSSSTASTPLPSQSPLPVSTTPTPAVSFYIGKNTFQANVGPGYCGNINQPCVSVQVCIPGTSTCQIVDKLVLDTGSSGLRIFRQPLNGLALNPVRVNGQELAQCMSYAGGNTQWGSVKSADVILGGEIASNIPIQVIDAAFGTVPTDCPNNDVFGSTGYNGILGVGLFTEDCGTGCASVAANRIYFSCSGAACTPVAVPVAQQVANPVAAMPLDNNGVILDFPAVPDAGSASVAGTITLGIGTQTNNAVAGATVFPTDIYGNFQTTFYGRTFTQAFIDSGSNGLFFPKPAAPAPNLPDCGAGATGFFCPLNFPTLTGTQIGAAGTPTRAISFKVINAADAVSQNNPNWVFNNVAGSISSTQFSWGFPFFLGRKIYVAIEKRSTPIGQGPYWAY